MPTHVIFLNGVYVRVLWVSNEQLEELMIYIHQAYKIHTSKTDKNGNVRATI